MLDDPGSATNEITGQIVAQRLSNGRTEFGWLPADSDERILPASRYFPADAPVGRWLSTRPLEIDGIEYGSISAQRLSNGKLEFGFTPTVGERILPDQRFFPASPRVGRWLRSSEITITIAAAPMDDGSMTGGPDDPDPDSLEGAEEPEPEEVITVSAITEISGQIAVRRAPEDGRIEFGWQPSGRDWRDDNVIKPAGRFFPTAITHNRWLKTTPVSVAGVEIGRINMRRTAADDPIGRGRIEFGFTPTNGEIIQPTARYFPDPPPDHNRWLRANQITFTIAATQPTTAADDQLEPDDSLLLPGDSPLEADSLEGDGITTVSTTTEISGQIVARRLSDGRTEFGWLPSGNDSDDPILPGSRYVPAGTQGDAWVTGLVIVAGVEIGSIFMIRQSDGRIEFALIYDDGLIYPEGRYFPATISHNRWLRSDQITFTITAETSDELRPGDGGDALDGGDEGLGPETDELGPEADGSGLLDDDCLLQDDSGNCPPPAPRVETPTPTESRFTAVSAGYGHTCGQSDNGAITCWGDNTDGQINNQPYSDFTAVSAGSYHTCGLRTNGEIACWGDIPNDDYGQPAVAPPYSDYITVSAGYDHTCALRSSGEI